MMQHNENTDDNAAVFLPSDDDLIGYLLGSSSAALRTKIEAWLATDESHGERLGEFAAIILAVSESPITASDIDDVEQPNRKLVVSDHSEQRSQYRFVIGLLTLAATVTLVIFSIRGFDADGLSDGRIALAWADSLTTGIDSEANANIPDWLLDADQSDGSAKDSTDDELVEYLSDAELSSEDLVDGETLIGFSSDEPPEWMLAGLAGLDSSGTSDETSEVQP